MKNKLMKIGTIALATLLLASCGDKSSSNNPITSTDSTDTGSTIDPTTDPSSDTDTNTDTIPPTPVETQLKFAVFADIQLCAPEQSDGAAANFGATANAPLALKSHFEFIKENNINVVLMNGDITNQANEKYYQYFESVLKNVFGEDESKYPEFVWNMGNHEWWWGTSEKETGDAVTMFKKYARINSSNLVKTSNVPYSINNNQTIPSYYKVINGVPLLAISAENSSGLVGSALYNELEGWLSEIKQLDSVKKGGPIFVQYHYPLTTSMTHGQGSNSDKCEPIERLFKDTPNAVVFTGDTHFPGINERSINQVDFTTINLGTSSYSRMVDQSAVICDDYDNVSGGGTSKADKMIGNAKYKEAYTPTIQVVEVMNNQTYTIDRYFTDVPGGRLVGNQWTFDPINSKDDFKYTNNRFQNKSAAISLYGKEGLSWSNDAKLSFGVKDGQMTVRFPEVIDYHYCEHYRISVNGTVYDEVSNYYKYLENAEENYYILKDVPASSSYNVTVTAYDFFDNPSLNTLNSNVNEESSIVDSIDAQLVNTYCDIQTKNNFNNVMDGSNSSVEYYYKGIQNYRYGAILGRVLSDGEAADCSNYISLTNKTNNNPILTASFKNLGAGEITVGLSVVKYEGSSTKWLNDFGKETQQKVSGNNWVTLSWNLKDLFGLTSRAELASIVFKANSSIATSNGYEMNFLMDNPDLYDGEIAPRGQSFTSGTDLSIALENIALTKTFSFDVKFTSEGYINFMLGEGWNNYFGYFEVSSNGRCNRDSAIITTLDDGYYRVSVNLSSAANYMGASVPTSYIDLLYIKGIWTDANGYIDINTSEGTEIRGKILTANTDFTYDLPTSLSLDSVFVFDIKFTSGTDTYINFMLGEGWNRYFGYYQINFDGTTNRSEVTVVRLDDGYYRVSVNLANASNYNDCSAPTSYVNLFYVRGLRSNASGYIDLNPNI